MLPYNFNNAVICVHFRHWLWFISKMLISVECETWLVWIFCERVFVLANVKQNVHKSCSYSI